MKKILVTGGAGFVGSNLIKKLRTDYPDAEITSYDNYFTGKKENHIKGVTYITGDTWNITHAFSNERGAFDLVYHFGEYSRIVKSFDDVAYVNQTILGGTPKVLELCRKWGAKLIYSASSSKFGNNGKDENLSPYSWAKAKMVELIKNYGEWFDLDYEICYFFNVYGPGQITTGDYATVIGIFERQKSEGIPLTVVSPGTQTRDFTHINDIVSGLIAASKVAYNGEWHLRSGKEYSILQVAEMFQHPYEIVPERRGERLSSAKIETQTESILGWKPVHSLEYWIAKINLD